MSILREAKLWRAVFVAKAMVFQEAPGFVIQENIRYRYILRVRTHKNRSQFNKCVFMAKKNCQEKHLLIH